MVHMDGHNTMSVQVFDCDYECFMTVISFMPFTGTLFHHNCPYHHSKVVWGYNNVTQPFFESTQVFSGYKSCTKYRTLYNHKFITTCFQQYLEEEDLKKKTTVKKKITVKKLKQRNQVDYSPLVEN